MRGYQNDEQRNYYKPTSHIVSILDNMLIWNKMCTCVSLVHHSVNSYISENWVTTALDNGLSPDVYGDQFQSLMGKTTTIRFNSKLN